jgi:uncharacterized membrane protein
LSPSPQGTGSFPEDVPERHATSESGSRAASVVGNALLAVSGAVLVGYALKQRSWKAAGVALAGAPFAYRQATGHWPMLRPLRGEAAREHALPVTVETSVTIGRPRQELYDFWRQLENLPQFMRHLDSVENRGDGISHWVGRSPLGTKLEWDAEIIEDREGYILSWRSLPGSQVDNAGSVFFEDAPDDRGTIVRVSFDAQPPAGPFGRAVGKVMNPITEQQVREDLRRFKSLMEAGEIPTTEGQPTGKRPAIHIHNPF